MKKSLLAFLASAEGNLEVFRSNVEKWYDSTMQAVTTWYENRTRIISFIVALLIAGGANIDTIGIGKFLSRDPSARSAIASMAADQAKAVTTTSGGETDLPLAKLQTLKKEYSLPIGWKGFVPDEFALWLEKIVGLLLTAFAASLGAPFWFDILRKLSDIRKEMASADQGPQAPTT